MGRGGVEPENSMTVACIRTEGRLRPGDGCERKKFVPTEAHFYREPPVGRRDCRNSQRTMPSQDKTGQIAPRWAPGSGSLLGWGHEKAAVVVGGREKNKQELGRWSDGKTRRLLGRALRGVAPGVPESMAEACPRREETREETRSGKTKFYERGRGWDENRKKGRSDR